MGAIVKSRIPAIVALLAMCACVSSSEIVPSGPDTYLIVGRANGGLNAGKGTIEATKKANDFCAGKHKVADIKNIETHGNAAVFGENANITFACIDATTH